MKLRLFPLLALLSLLLSACSSDDIPDSVTEDEGQVTAIKRIPDSDFELRLVVDRLEEGDKAFTAEAGLRYVGDQPEVTIVHGDPLFIGSLMIDDKRVGGPAGINTVAISTPMKADEWLTEKIDLPASKTQIKQFYEKDGNITLYAGFSADDYEDGRGTDATLTLKAEEIPR
ncbi:hypothetical protein [Saccharibacillus alkalitolerans]|uniref:Lipoprotein n=1 Tax=Saccharibacillus alkalitolerans TaxID=2705290 RepID=A0ABX0FAM0_9BACL|nr:hypothetical protein [Saccharibacillus alkalitolerans]NGZ77991.1 hypothetical protein [Saccharibacillus alkalitolerans]